MIANRIRGMRLVHTSLLGLVSAVLFWAWLAALVTLVPGAMAFKLTNYLVYCGVVVGAFAIDLVISKVRDTDLLNLDLAAVLRLSVRQTFTVLVTVLFFLVAAKDQVISRIFLFTFVPVLYGVLLLSNRVLPIGLAKFLFRHKRAERTLLVGDRDDADRVLSWCKSKAHYGMEVVGFVSTRPGAEVEGLSMLGTVASTLR